MTSMPPSYPHSYKIIATTYIAWTWQHWNGHGHMNTWQILKNTHDTRVGHASDTTWLHSWSFRVTYRPPLQAYPIFSTSASYAAISPPTPSAIKMRVNCANPSQTQCQIKLTPRQNQSKSNLATSIWLLLIRILIQLTLSFEIHFNLPRADYEQSICVSLRGKLTHFALFH